MKTKSFLMLSASILLVMASCKQERTNPLLVEYKAPFGVPPFDQIKVEHYQPAFAEAIKQHLDEIETIVTNSEEPSFANTIEALEYSGRILQRVSTTFYPLTSAHTNSQMQKVEQEVASMLSNHSDDVNLNPKLFERVKAVYAQKEQMELNAEQQMLLNKTFKRFVRGGANLQADEKERFRQINEQLSLLELKFSHNVLSENNQFKLVIDDRNDLAGLPENLVGAAAEAAQSAGLPGKWVFTLHAPSIFPFLQFSEKRELREKIFRGYFMRGDNDNEFDNKQLISEIVSLRAERAHLLGYPSYAAFVLDETMAKTPENVTTFLGKLWTPALERAKTEASDMQKIIDGEGGNFKLAPWDWWYYSEKVRKAKYDLNEEMLRPFFPIDGVKKGIFLLTEKLYGLKYNKLDNVPTYHPEAEVYEVTEANGQHIGLLYLDFYPRESKLGGAWMTSYRDQYITQQGEFIAPIVTVVCNFTRPSANAPALLSIDETETFFHEFGHALHGLLAHTTYPSISGTNVPRDFVELPSQIMENWSTDPEFLKMYAFHYQTGEIIPDELIGKLQASSTFNQGFATVEYLASAILDMDFYTLSEPQEVEPRRFEKEAMQKIGLISEIIPRYRSTYFNHIFNLGYSSGYYSYIWAGLLDADAYEAFKETGNIFDAETAQRFRENVLSRGGTEDPMELYIKFRGAEPKPEPLLKRRGLI